MSALRWDQPVARHLQAVPDRPVAAVPQLRVVTQPAAPVRFRALPAPELHLDNPQRNLFLGGIFFALALFVFALVIFAVAVFSGGVEGSLVTVANGDTLWSIAADMGADVPLNQVVADIMALNSLSDTSLFAGDILVLPNY